MNVSLSGLLLASCFFAALIGAWMGAVITARRCLPEWAQQVIRIKRHTITLYVRPEDGSFCFNDMLGEGKPLLRFDSDHGVYDDCVLIGSKWVDASAFYLYVKHKKIIGCYEINDPELCKRLMIPIEGQETATA